MAVKMFEQKKVVWLVRVRAIGEHGLAPSSASACPLGLGIPCISENGESYCRGLPLNGLRKQLSETETLITCNGRVEK